MVYKAKEVAMLYLAFLVFFYFVPPLGILGYSIYLLIQSGRTTTSNQTEAILEKVQISNMALIGWSIIVAFLSPFL